MPPAGSIVQHGPRPVTACLQVLEFRPWSTAVACLGTIQLQHGLRGTATSFKELDLQRSQQAKLRERSLRSLYFCSDGVRGRGAPVTNLSHKASFHSCERIAPSNRGIKHLSWALEEK